MSDDLSFLAVIGMAGRFPGARDLDRFWENLASGTESVTTFPPEDDYIPACGLLDGADEFDAGFFGYSPREALIIDPQQRVFLECAWHALEDAGYDTLAWEGIAGIFAGGTAGAYLDTMRALNLPFVNDFQLRLAVNMDGLATRTAYKLNLRGPSVTVQTACSTSLVAIHMAGQAILAGECDLALAGGVCAHVPPELGTYTEGGYLSPDGHCRAFDAMGSGTVGGDGVGVVVLKRLVDALADGDHVRAVLRGTAVNNDGAGKIGYTAPGVGGQTDAIRAAHLVAGVDPATISYVEAHGTATKLGDPIEIVSLTNAFQAAGTPLAKCFIGSVKTNIGHVDAAAGVAGFIKTVLALEHRQIPPSLHFEKPNPEIDFESGPFEVNTELREWPESGTPRRAGISSFGIGGTNAHVVVEEAAPVPPSEETGPQLLVLSARTPAALDRAALRLFDHLSKHPELSLADVAWTLQTGRRHFPERLVAVTSPGEDGQPISRRARVPAGDPPSVSFVFPGQGGQHPDMGRELYRAAPAFRAVVDECCTIATPLLGFDLRDLLFAGEADGAAGAARIAQTAISQPAVFIVEYALARLWMSWGIRPARVLGHSLGAYAAACIAGIFTLADAIAVVIERGRLLQDLAPGGMLAVSATERQIIPLLTSGLDIAAINGPSQCVVSGPTQEVEAFSGQLNSLGIDTRRLHISAPGHSAMVDPIVDAFRAEVAKVQLHEPVMPYLSESSGGHLPPAAATEPEYWAGHMRKTVRFSDAAAALLAAPEPVVLEVGPSRTLTSLIRRHPDRTDRHLVLPSLPHPSDDEPEFSSVLSAVGQLWLAGLRPDWTALHAGAARSRVSLPGYPFEPQRFPVEPGAKLPEFDGLATESAWRPPSTAIEQAVADVFADILGLDRVGAEDDFFELGGDSLIAAALNSWVRRTYPIDIPAKSIFMASTVTEFAAVIADHIVAEEQRG